MRRIDMGSLKLSDVTFVSDVHLANHVAFGDGTDERGHNKRLLAIMRALDGAIARGGCLFILGDVFDDPNPRAVVVSAFVSFLRVAQSRGVHVLGLVGNHDGPSKRSALDALDGVYGFRCISEPTLVEFKHGNGGAECVIALPFARAPVGSTASDEFNKRISGLSGAFNGTKVRDQVVALVSHLPLAFGNAHVFNPDETVRVTSELIGQLRFAFPSLGAVLCGDVHKGEQHVVFGAAVANTGALVPTGFDNVGGDSIYGGAWRITDSGAPAPRQLKLVRESVLGPRFFDVSSGPELSLVLDRYAGRAYVRTSNEAVLALCENHMQRGELLGIRYDPSVTRSEVAALRPEVTPSTIAEAIARFVDAMPLGSDADRAEVLARVSRKLGGE